MTPEVLSGSRLCQRCSHPLNDRTGPYCARCQDFIELRMESDGGEETDDGYDDE